jgi:hypothetical protein
MKGYPGAGNAYNSWDGWMNPQEETNLTRWEPSPTKKPCAGSCLFDVTGACSALTQVQCMHHALCRGNMCRVLNGMSVLECTVFVH